MKHLGLLFEISIKNLMGLLISLQSPLSSLREASRTLIAASTSLLLNEASEAEKYALMISLILGESTSRYQKVSQLARIAEKCS